VPPTLVTNGHRLRDVALRVLEGKGAVPDRESSRVDEDRRPVSRGLVRDIQREGEMNP
jgi:hypothetical protein